MSRDSPVNSLSAGYNSGDQSQSQQGFSLFATAPSPALVLTHLPMKCVPRTPFPVVNRPKRDAELSSTSSDNANKWSYTFTSPYSILWCFKRRGKFIFFTHLLASKAKVNNAWVLFSRTRTRLHTGPDSL